MFVLTDNNVSTEIAFLNNVSYNLYEIKLMLMVLVKRTVDKQVYFYVCLHHCEILINKIGVLFYFLVSN